MNIGAQQIRDVNIKPLTDLRAWKALEDQMSVARHFVAVSTNAYLNSSDRWGVELGKVLAQRILPELEGTGARVLGHDSSTNNLIRCYRNLKETHYDHRV